MNESEARRLYEELHTRIEPGRSLSIGAGGDGRQFYNYGFGELEIVRDSVYWLPKSGPSRDKYLELPSEIESAWDLIVASMGGRLP
jgi:hypothetical protein